MHKGCYGCCGQAAFLSLVRLQLMAQPGENPSLEGCALLCFCTQACVQRSWPAHYALHSARFSYRPVWGAVVTGRSCCTVGLSLTAVSPTVSRQALEQVFGSFSASSLSLTLVQPQRQTAALLGCSSHIWGRQEQMPGPSNSHVNALRPVCSCLSVLQLPLGGHQRCMVHREE